jgi:tripartite-type tricarboxylate transporter receptor subunit TctC
MMGHIGTLAVNPGLYQRLPYDPLKSFQPITLVATVANVLVVHPSISVANAAELVAYAKANPGKLSYGSGGNGSAAHIAMAAFMYASGTEMLHVPYRGTGPMVNDLLAGQIALTMTGGPAVLPLVRTNKLKGLGVSSTKRIGAAPDLPTLADAAGLPGFDATQWYGVVAPAGTPREIVDKLNGEIRKALTLPDVMERLSSEGADPTPGTPEEFGQFIATEMKRWGDLIRATNLKVD